MTAEATTSTPEKRSLSGLQVFLIVLATIIITVGVTYWVLRTYIFPAEFRPVELSVKEEQVLNAKLEQLDSLQVRRTRGTAKIARQKAEAAANQESLEPEAYSEEGADRSITLSERELNGLLAKNTDLARKLAIDLSQDLLSAKLLVPVDEDFPMLGGQTLKVRWASNSPTAITALLLSSRASASWACRSPTPGWVA